MTDTPKKRGRKPREISYMNNTFSEVSHEEHPVLALPISLEEIQVFENNTKVQEILLEPPNILEGFEELSLEAFHPTSVSELPSGIQNSQVLAEFSDTNEEDYIVKDTINDSGVCSYITQEIHNSKVFPKQMVDAYNYSVIKSISVPELQGLYSVKVDVHCWWCCHQFDTSPVYLPIKHDIVKSTNKEYFRVKGCFCSFNCALAYGIKNGYTGTKALIRLMRSVLCGVKITEPIEQAPSRETLKIFGGPNTIEEFRESFKTMDKYDFTEFPLIHIVHQTKITKHKKIDFTSKVKTEIPKTRIHEAEQRLSSKSSSSTTSVIPKGKAKTIFTMPDKKQKQTLEQIINITYE